MTKTEELLELIELAFKMGDIKKLILSRPENSEIQKVTGRLCKNKDKRLLALEYCLPGNTVKHKNLDSAILLPTLTELVGEYKQVNLITSIGEAEYRVTKSGSAALLGGEKLMRKLKGTAPAFEAAIAALDNQKNRILTGGEDFLITLGVSDKSGRVHDKKQGKFRQINRFLEYIEELYEDLPSDKELVIYDLCCGKSYLSFAVYYYLTALKGRRVRLLGIDLKRDVIDWCQSTARALGYAGMEFVYDDVKNTPKGCVPDMVISLHACDIATDIVINRAAELGAGVILSTPCCHRYMNGKINTDALSFVTDHAHIRNKLCEALTDGLRILRLEKSGYRVNATELTDPDATPKNTLIRAIKQKNVSTATLTQKAEEYENALKYLFGAGYKEYLKEIE